MPSLNLAAVTHWLRGTARFTLDAVLPPRCLSCGQVVDTPGALCAICWGGIVFLTEPCCARCGLPFPYEAGIGALCPTCTAQPPEFDRARSVMAYDDRSRRLLLALKHADRLHGVPAYGAWLARTGASLLADADLIVPVPLHWSRLWHRRYNQSALLAHAVAAALGPRPKAPAVVAADLLIRRRRTPPQGRRTRAQRAINVRGAFRIRPVRDIAGAHVVLIDDVLTSGATVDECARILRRAGAARVDVLTLARAMRAQ